MSLAAPGSSLRVDDYCIIYTIRIRDEILLISVVGLGHHREVYRD